jgi:hypothetical protein
MPKPKNSIVSPTPAAGSSKNPPSGTITNGVSGMPKRTGSGRALTEVTFVKNPKGFKK